MGSSGAEDIAKAYTQSGIDYSKMDPFKVLAQNAGLETAEFIERFSDIHEVESSRGDSSYLIELPDAYLAHVEEGLGTKNLVADAVEKLTGKSYYRAIAQDTVATIINDLITCGAAPLTIAMHLAVGSSDWFEDTRRVEELVAGWRDACKIARCTWGGGETPTLKDIVNPDSAVLAGSATGLIKPKSRRIQGNIQAGDAIILLESSGIQTNGLTLARKVASRLPDGYLTRLSDGTLYGEAILAPSIIYTPVLEDILIEGVPLHYAVHITGHGWRKLMRANLPYSYIIEQSPEPQPVFTLLQEQARIDDYEAYATFNMGAAFALMLPPEHVAQALQVAQRHGIKAWAAGTIEKRGDTKEVIIVPKKIEYKEETLAVR